MTDCVPCRIATGPQLPEDVDVGPTEEAIEAWERAMDDAYELSVSDYALEHGLDENEAASLLYEAKQRKRNL